MAFRIAPGRRLRWSPNWSVDDASVLFDSCSGDFWLLDTPTRELLLQVEAQPGLSADEVLAQGRWTAPDLSEVVSSLVAAGVLMPALASPAQASG